MATFTVVFLLIFDFKILYKLFIYLKKCLNFKIYLNNLNRWQKKSIKDIVRKSENWAWLGLVAAQ